MSKKIIFIDVDGTLVGFTGGKQMVPESAINAIKQARKNGHLVYLCTGRSNSELLDILPIGFDGVISAAGGYIESNGNTLFHKKLSNNEVHEILKFFDDNNVSYILECNSGLFVTNSFRNNFIKYIYHDQLPEDESYISIMQPIENADLSDVNKMLFMSDTTPFEIVEKQFKNKFLVLKASWTNDTGMCNGEITLTGINKATAIEYLINYLNIDIKDTYAFGDSMNDIEMFNCVNTAIAMGNSMHNVKEYADFITKDVNDDGIEFGMKYFNLI